MPSNDDISNYAKCMELIKLRIRAIDEFMEKKRSTGYPQTDREFILLQFRFVFEQIAMSSLCSNREKYEEIRSAFQKDRNATLILKTVARTNPAFYPQPVVDVKLPDGKIFAKPVTNGFLTVDELRRAIGFCGDNLHPYNVYRGYKAVDVDEEQSRFLGWRNGVVNLLNKHMVWLVGGVNLSVIMNEVSSGRVSVQELQRRPLET